MAVVHDGRLLELVGGLGGEQVKDHFRDLLERSLQKLVDAELTEAVGAERHERTESRTNQRNWGRPRMLSAPAGDVELRLPKVRPGSSRHRSSRRRAVRIGRSGTGDDRLRQVASPDGGNQQHLAPGAPNEQASPETPFRDKTRSQPRATPHGLSSGKPG